MIRGAQVEPLDGYPSVSLAPASLVGWFFGVVMFLIGLGLALHHGWSKLELFWGVWTASASVTVMMLTAAHLSIGILSLRHAVTQRVALSGWVFGTLGILILAGVSAWLLGQVYLLTVRYMSSAMAQQPEVTVDATLIADLARTYWPLVVGGLLVHGIDAAGMLRVASRRRVRGTDLIERLAPDDRMVALWLMFRTALLSTVGFFAATFVFIVSVRLTGALGLDPGWWLYAVVFAAFYFLPGRPKPFVEGAAAEREKKRWRKAVATQSRVCMLDEETRQELEALFGEPELTLSGRRHRYPNYRSLYASPEFIRFAEGLRHAGEDRRLKEIEAVLEQKIYEELARA
jgi:hypothetical protein